MSKNYNQLSFEQRNQIEALVKAGIKQKDIALQLKAHASTISRELKRNVAPLPQASRLWFVTYNLMALPQCFGLMQLHSVRGWRPRQLLYD
jgi:hypothetical protein